MRMSALQIALFILLPALASGCFKEPRDPVAERVSLFKDEMDGATVRFPDEPLTLHAAIAHALENNLSVRAAEMEFAITHEISTYSALKMLPSLQADLNLTQRNKYNASSSQSLESGRQSLEPSYSSEKFGHPSGVTLAWSLMDLGMGVLRNRQAGERMRISGENLRRLRQQIAMETAIAYCRFRAAEDILRHAASLEEAIKLQLRFNRLSSEEGSMAGTEEAKRAAPLLGGLKTLADIRREAQTARAALAKAMGVTRPAELALDTSVAWPDELPALPDDPDALYETAVTNRPEMYTADSETAISRDEARAALLQMAPNVNLSASLHNNPDRFIVYNNWMEAALQVSWDMLRFPLRQREAKTAGQRAELSALKRRMTAASVLVQINLALAEMAAAAERVELTELIEENRRVILRGAEDAAGTGKGNKVDVLSERLRHLSDYAGMAWARSDHMTAKARLLSALGVDFYDSGWTPRVGGMPAGSPEPRFATAALRDYKPTGRTAARVSLPKQRAEGGDSGANRGRAGRNSQPGTLDQTLPAGTEAGDN